MRGRGRTLFQKGFPLPPQYSFHLSAFLFLHHSFAMKKRTLKKDKQQSSGPILRGRYTALRNGGGGFVTPLDAQGRVCGEDIFIPAYASGGAWHQDIVSVQCAAGRRRPGMRQEGRIAGIEARGLTEIPAHMARRRGGWLECVPADGRLNFRLRVPVPEGEEMPHTGDLLVIAPEYALDEGLWLGRLVARMGREDDVRVQEELVKCNHETPREFPPRVLAEAEALPGEPGPEDWRDREDLRDAVLVTIDGEDARDFDDAVEVTPEAGGWLLRVAIADVSHYVRPRSGLDDEARERGNSWYFPTSVEPMLPFALSNGLCSLVPGRPRLAMLAEVHFDRQGRPGATRFAPVVIRSAARLTYTQVKACVLDRDAEARAALAAAERGDEVLRMLDDARALFEVLRQARLERGSLDFDVPEPAYEVDGEGRLLSVRCRERHDAHRMIEEFMIAANEAVARWLGRCRLAADGRILPPAVARHDGAFPQTPREESAPFLYRVHPLPDAERLESLFDTLRATALEAAPSAGTAADAGGLRTALLRARGTEQEFLVNRLCLRAMPQARYQTRNEGHFGLASQAYCHFTSPIRRYADLTVHRVLKNALGMDTGPLPAGQRLERVADGLNRRERAAMDAEREMARRMACLALRGREGEVFHGVISGLMEFGLFVELADMPVEGMIRVEDLGPDWYEYDARRQTLSAVHGGGFWRLGQALDVRLLEVRPGRLEIRLVPAAAGDEDGRRPRRRGRSRGPARREAPHGKRPASRERSPRGSLRDEAKRARRAERKAARALRGRRDGGGR